MAAGRDVKISIRVEGGDSERVVRRLTNAFEQTETAARRAAQASSTITDKDVFSKAAGTSKQFLNEMINSGGMRQYQEVLRQFAPQLRTLQENLKAGSFSQEDFNRRVASMPPLMQRAMRDAAGLGQNIRGLGGDAAHGANGLQAMLIKADLAARAIAFLTEKIGEGWREYQDYGRELAKIDTILGSGGNVEKFRDEILELNPALGGATELARGLYLALGSDIAEQDAMSFLVDSAKAAKAGVADLSQTIDAGTTIIASYNLQAKDAADVYDKMFEVVNRGKVEMPQLAQSIGQVTAVAAIAGVTLDELFAAVATATLTNKPSIAIEGLRTALSNVIKPSEQAKELAQSIGLEFNAAALKAKGFAQFLREVSEKTGNSADKLAVLFGDIQGFNIVASLAGQNADKFAENLTAIGDAAGTVDSAFAKQQQSLGVQFDNFTNRITKGFISAFQTAEPVIKFVLAALDTLLPAIVAVTVAVGGLKLAWLLLNTQMIVTAGAGIGNAIAALQLMWGAVLSVAAGTATLTTTLAVATSGLTLLAAAIGIGVYAYSQYSAAQEKSTDEHLKAIEAAKTQMNALGEQSKTLASLTGGVGELTLEQGELAAIYKTLDTASKNRVDGAVAEKGAVGALADELERLNRAKGLELDSRLTELAQTTYTAYLKQAEAAEAARKAEEALQKARENGLRDLLSTNVKTGQQTVRVSVEQQFESLRKSQIETAEASRTAAAEFETLKQGLQTGAGILGTTADKFVQAKTAARQMTDVNGDFIQSLTAAGSAQTDLAGKMDATSRAIAEQTQKVTDLRGELAKLVSVNQQNIDTRLFNVIKYSKTDADFLENLKRAKKDLKNDIDAVNEINSKHTRGRDFLQPSEKSGSNRIKTDADAARKSVRELKDELGDLQSVLDAMRKGTMAQESGGNINARNARTGALSLFQVMPANIPNWTKKYVGKILSAEQFKNDVDAQIKVFNGEMGKYLQAAMKKSGGDVNKAVRMAAAAWYGGQGAMHRYDDPKVFRKGEPSFREYTTKVLEKTQRAAGGGKEFAFIEFDAAAQSLREIEETRYRINKLIEGGADAIQEELTALREFESNLQSIEATIREINELGVLDDQLVVMMPATENAAAAKRAELDLLKSTLENFKQLREDAARQVIELGAEFDNGITPLAMFDLEIRKLKDAGAFTAEFFENVLTPAIEKTRIEMQKAADAGTAKKLREAARAAADALGGISENFRTATEDLNKSDALDFLRSIEQIAELRFDGGALTEIRGLFTAGSLIDTDKFAEYVREWLTMLAAFGTFDAAKIDEVVAKLRGATEGFNKDSIARRDQRFDSFKQSLEDELDQIRRNGRELTEYERTLRDLERGYRDLDPAQKEYLLNLAAEIDAQTELRRLHAELTDFFRETITLLSEGDIQGLFTNFANRVKDNFINKLSEFLATNILGFDPNATDNPVAKPIVGKLDETNKLLRQLVLNSGGAAAGLPSIGGINLGSIFGGNAGGGIFNFGGGQSVPGAGPALSGLGPNALGLGQPGGGGFLSSIKGLFGTKDGGIFAPRKNVFGGSSRLAGILGGAGDIAALAGGLIGGRFGGILSSAGTGMSIGSMFGPWGAAIGAGIGALFGLFGGDPKRKRDKREKMPQLNQGFADAFNELRQLIEDVRFLRADPDSAISRGRELRNQIASGFGLQFESKKYRKESQRIIQQKLAEIDRVPDGLMEQLKKAVEEARAAGDRTKRILPEFAGGNYFADYFKPNGLIPGVFDKKDDLLAMISRGEMVLNPQQQARIRASAGFDVFAEAQIPNYPSKPSMPRPRFAGGADLSGTRPVFAPQPPQIVVKPNLTVVLNGDTFDERADGYMQSDGGERTLVKLINGAKKQGKIR
ncbi:MAG: phage tail tape measure protein [Pyrinomonadaceae bacterium]|nr:phage tail tape measure protein [Pyrinomonadaceae bacterium]